MATQAELHAAHMRMRSLLREADLPDPDEVEYGDGEIVLLWHETETAVVVDLHDKGDEGPLYHA